MISAKLNCYLGRCCYLLILAILFCSSQVQAQGTPPIPPGAPDAPPPVDAGEDDNNLFGNGGGGGGGTTAGDNDDAVDIDDAASLDLGGQGEDNRNQGFVGATAPGVTENNFVGAASQTFGALAEGATFGGGVNDGATSSVPSGAGGGGGRFGGGGAGGFGAVNGGGSVIRSSLRTRLRPSFTAPRIAPQVIEGNFYNNIARQPSAQSLVGRYQVFVENKSATVVGTVNTRAEADRLIRQLRLQPGIYEIDNQLQVSELPGQ